MSEDELETVATDAIIAESVAEDFAALCHRSMDLLRHLEWNDGGHMICPSCHALMIVGEKHNSRCTLAGLLADLRSALRP